MDNMNLNTQKQKEIKHLYDKFIQYQISLNIDIEKNFFKQIRFKDSIIEQKFQENQKSNHRLHKIFSDIVIFLGYIASLLYIFFSFYKIEILIICVGSKLISIISTIISYKMKNNKFFYNLLEHLNIFSLVSSLFIKCCIVNFYYNTSENDNEAEHLRIIIYCFVSTNLFLCLKFPANFFVYLFYYSVSVIMIFITTLKSNRNHFYFLEGMTSFLLSFIFWGFRKIYDYLLRIYFSEKYKFEKFYNYTFHFIFGLNSFHVNFENDNINFIDPKFEDILYSFDRDFKIFEGLSQTNDRNEAININHSMENEKFMNINNNSVSNLKTEKFPKYLKEFTKLLIPFKDIYSIQNNDNNRIFKEKFREVNQNNISCQIALKEIKEVNLYQMDLFLELNEENLNLFSLLELIKNNKNFNSEDNFNCFKINNFIKLGIFNFKNEEINKYFEIYFRKVNFYQLDKTFDANNKDNFQYDLLFYDVSELILSKKKIYEENIIKQKILAKIAHEFKTPINSIIGLISTIKDNSLNISMTSEDRNFSKENKLKSKNDEIIYKRSNLKHSSKNMITGSQKINVIEDENGLISKNDSKSLRIIENLSKYVIFLIGDIIQYSNMKESQINLNFETIKLKEIANFVFEILKALLNCSIAKKKSIKPELFIEDSLMETTLNTDDLRIKQILLNIISNSVKFTKHGKINLSFKLNKNKDEIEITIEDTGIGVREEDKKKLFNDFVMLGDEAKQNSQGSGLGLSICKNLASKLNLKLNFESVYGNGSKFFVYIPFNNRIEDDNNIDNQIILVKDKHNYAKKEKPNLLNLSNDYFSLQIIGVTNQKCKLSKFNTKTINKKKASFVSNPYNNLDESLKLTTRISNFNPFINDYINIKYKINLNNTENDSENTDLNFSGLLNKDANAAKFLTEIQFDKQIINRQSNKNLLPFSENITKFSELNMHKIKNDNSFHEKTQEIKSYENSMLDQSILKSPKNNKNKILIVDDNDLINDSIKQIMEKIIAEYKLDLDVIQASDGVDMLKSIIEDQKEGNFIKCVFTDEYMEYINGSEAIRIIRRLERENKIKRNIIFSISSGEDKDNCDMILSSGTDHVLGKPVSKSVIINCLKKFKVIL